MTTKRIGIHINFNSKRLTRRGPFEFVARRLKLFCPDHQEAVKMMSEKALQYEIDQLRGVSSRLELLADQHPIMEREIMTISGNILSNAVLLEVLLALRAGSA